MNGKHIPAVPDPASGEIHGFRQETAMRRLALIAAFGLLIPLQFGGCPHHHRPGFAPPGQVQKKTGYNPASGKLHPAKIKAKGK